jgi:pyruvate formate lyase activating enzyme
MNDIAEIARFAADLGGVERVDVLPFHQLGRYKWDKLDLDYKLRDTEPPSPALVEEACAQFRKFGLTAY